MADPQFIYFGGFPIPIHSPYPVLTYKDSLSFYAPEAHAKPGAVARGQQTMLAIYRARQAPNRGNLGDIDPSKVPLLEVAPPTPAPPPPAAEGQPPAPPTPPPPPIKTWSARRSYQPNYSFRRAPGTRQGFDGSRGLGQEVTFLGRQHVFQVVLHHDVTFSSEDCYNVLVARGLSTHFMINHDGTIYQPLDLYHMAWAQGANNNHGVGIDLNNPARPEYLRLRDDQPPRAVYNGWINGSVKVGLGYTDAQYEALIALLAALITPVPEKNNWVPLARLATRCFPPLDAQGNVIKHVLRNDGLNFIGFMGHWHCKRTKWDPGPGFDWFRVLAGLHGKRKSLPVMLPGATPLRGTLSARRAAQTFELYHQNIENNQSGGWYPIGLGQNWHSGVHLAVPPDSPVFAMGEGRIVAVRNTPLVDRGDPSFVLIRHELPPLTDDEGNEGEPRVYYSLSMHLQQVFSPQRLRPLPWARALLGADLNLEPPFVGVDEPVVSPAVMPPKVFDAREAEAAEVRERLTAGDIIICDVPVEMGEPIGYAGVFGQEPWITESLVHVECFSSDNLFPPTDTHSQKFGWQIIEGDLDDDSLAGIVSLSSLIANALGIPEDARPLVSNEYVFKNDELRSFYSDPTNTPQRRDLRRMITFHISEWSARTDWSVNASTHAGWPWRSQKAFSDWLWHWVPFRWLNEEVTELLELPETHRFYYYHPISLLEYLNSSYTGGIRGTAEAEAVADDAAAELERLRNKIAWGEILSDEERARYRGLMSQQRAEGGDYLPDLESSIGASVSIEGFDVREFGEWPPPGDD